MFRNIFFKFQRNVHIFCRKNVRHFQLLSVVFPVVYSSSHPHKRIEVRDPAELSHSFLLKQASNVTANSVSQLLNQTVSAIIDNATVYKKALNDLMIILEECQSNIGNEIFQQEMTDLMISYRAKVHDCKSQFLELQSLFEYVEKVVISVSETSFLVGGEYASGALSELLYSAKQKILEERKNIESLEHELLKLQNSYIKSSSDNKDRKNS